MYARNNIILSCLLVFLIVAATGCVGLITHARDKTTTFLENPYSDMRLSNILWTIDNKRIYFISSQDPEEYWTHHGFLGSTSMGRMRDLAEKKRFSTSLI